MYLIPESLCENVKTFFTSIGEEAIHGFEHAVNVYNHALKALEHCPKLKPFQKQAVL